MHCEYSKKELVVYIFILDHIFVVVVWMLDYRVGLHS